MAVGLRQQRDRVGAAIALVVGGKQRADVPETCCTEQRVGERMREHVAVGVADEPERVVELDAPEHERDRRRRTHARRRRCRRGTPSAERLPARPAAFEHGDRLAAGVPRERKRLVEVDADQIRLVRIRGERDRGSRADARLEKGEVRVELANRLPEAGGRDLDGDGGSRDRQGSLLLQDSSKGSSGRLPKIFGRSG